MPVFINEIVFRGEVGSSSNKKPETETTASEQLIHREQLSEDAVAEVMRLLRRQEER